MNSTNHSTYDPNVTLDRVVTIAIGRNDPITGQPMANANWNFYKSAIVNDVHNAGATVVFLGEGQGITSDSPDTYNEQSYVAIVLTRDETMENDLRWRISNTLKVVKQGSAAFICDRRHEPVFPTATTYRTPSTSTPATAAFYRPTHGGYPNA